MKAIVRKFLSDVMSRGSEQPAAPALDLVHPTLVHALAAAARADRDIVFVPQQEDAPDVVISFRAMYDRAAQVAVALRERGVNKGDRVLLVLPTSPDFFHAFFGVQMLGAIPVPAYPPVMMEKAELALERLRQIACHAGATSCITDRTLLPILGGLSAGTPLQDLVAVEKLQGDHQNRRFELRIKPSDPALIQYTSGSTGNPKGVLLTHSNLMHNVHAMGTHLRWSADDVVMSWLPLYHDMGLIGAFMNCLYWGVRLIVMTPPSFLMRPVRWLRKITEYRATVAPAPNFAYGMCVKRVRPEDRAGIDLSSMRAFMNGAEPVSLQTLIEFEEAYAPHGLRPNAFMPIYGLAESSVGVTFPEPGAPLKFEVVDRRMLAIGEVVAAEGAGAIALVSVGRPFIGHEARILDEDGRPLPERKIGHIVSRGPSVMQGYFENPEATAKVLKQGWLWTGDLGYMSDGHLFITGRAKDMLIVRGKNYYSEDIERESERIRGVRPGGVVAFSVFDQRKDTEVAIVVCETRMSDEAERAKLGDEVRQIVSEQCGLSLERVVLVQPGTIPKTSSGKRQRSLTRDAYLEDRLVPHKTGKLKLALVLARSMLGLAQFRWRHLTRVPRIA